MFSGQGSRISCLYVLTAVTLQGPDRARVPTALFDDLTPLPDETHLFRRGDPHVVVAVLVRFDAAAAAAAAAPLLVV